RPNGTPPSRSAAASATHRTGVSVRGVVAAATAVTPPAAAAPKRTAEHTRAARRTRGGTGSVRTNSSQPDVRSDAIPTPNWKKTTPRIATATKPARRVFAGWRYACRKTRKSVAGKRSAERLKDG